MVPFDVEREYRQRRMSGAGQDLFHMNDALLSDFGKMKIEQTVLYNIE